MSGILGLGRYLYGIVILIFGLFHFMNASQMAGMAPFGGEIMIYFTGLALVAAAVSIFIGKLDKLSGLLLAIMLILFALLVHAPGLGDEATQQTSMSNMLKDLGLAGAALMSASLAKDRSVIG